MCISVYTGGLTTGHLAVSLSLLMEAVMAYRPERVIRIAMESASSLLSTRWDSNEGVED